jgi:hypothetical protein
MATRKTTKRGITPELKLSFKLDAKKIAQIQRCLKKGKLTITVAKVSRPARGSVAYIYD